MTIDYETTICGLLRSTGRKGMEETIAWLKSGDSYFDAAASEMGHDNWRGGLASHSYDVYENAMADWQTRDDAFKAKYPKESVIIASLLHDVFKKNVYTIAADGYPIKNKEVRKLGHGMQSLRLLKEIGLELTNDESQAIWWHMGEFEVKREDDYKPTNPYQAEFEAAMADPFCQLIHNADDIAHKISNRKKTQALNEQKVWNGNDVLFQLRSKSPHVVSGIRLRVYKNNQMIFSDWQYQAPSGNIISLGDRQALIDGTKVYKEKVDANGVASKASGTITGCINEDCLVVAKMLVDRGLNPAVLNPADALHACGGYNKGMGTQEESICRASTLSLTLYQYFNKQWAKKANVAFRGESAYPMDPHFGGIYSPGVLVFRDNESTGFALREEPFQTAIISVASINLHDSEHNKTDNLKYGTADGGFTPEGEQVMLDKIRTIYRIALLGGHDSLVLGDFGCAIYRLKPELVAELFHRVLQESEFKDKFHTIVFAINEGQASSRKKVEEEGKYAAFYEKFGKYQKCCPRRNSKGLQR